MNPLVALLAFLALLLPTSPCPQDDGGTLDAAARRSAVERLAELVEARYCLPDVAAQIATHLRSELAAGSFDGCATRSMLAGALAPALRAVNGDKHFKVRVRPPGEIEQDERDPLGEWLRESEELRQHNFGLTRAEVLPGNVGLLELRAFAPLGVTHDTAVAALGFLSGVDALVIDVRENGGGDPATVQLVCSYFFGQRTHLNSLVYRRPEGGEKVDEFWTLEEVPGRRLPDVPLFVVASGYTGSAAEEFTYNLKSRERALIVGETTVGAANPGAFFGIDERLEAFISTGQARNPVTGTNWEGAGVVPDVEAPAAQALDRALDLARRSAEEYRVWRREEREAAMADVRKALSRASELAEAGRLDEAVGVLRGPLAAALERGVLGERVVDMLGFAALESGKVDRALVILSCNAEAFPTSANAHDSLGAAWREKGDRKRALECYRRALELDPRLESARQAIEELARPGRG